MSDRPRRVLVLTAGYGEGHNAAARHLAEALNSRAGVVATTHDPLSILGPAYERSRRDYLRLAAGAPWLWRGIYGLLDRFPAEWVVAPFLRRVEAEVQMLVEATDADVVVSTYPLYPFLLARISRRTGLKLFCAVVVTDSISINRIWCRAPAELRLCADRYSARILVRMGVLSSSIRPTGFPVSPRFAGGGVSPPIRPAGPVRVLLVCGSANKNPAAFARALASVPGVSLTVTVGRDDALGAELRDLKTTSGHLVRVVGWTDAMPELLRGHDVVFAKAGGAMTHEAFAARVPLVFTQVLPGQEEGNARLAVRLRVGEVATTPAAARAALVRLLGDNSAELRIRAARLHRVARADGAVRAARAILDAVAAG